MQGQAALFRGIKGLKEVADGAFVTTPKSSKKEPVRRSMQRLDPKYVASVEKVRIPGYELFAATFNHCEVNRKRWTATELPSWLTDDDELKAAIRTLLKAKKVDIKPTSIKVYFPRAVCQSLPSIIHICLGRQIAGTLHYSLYTLFEEALPSRGLISVHFV